MKLKLISLCSFFLFCWTLKGRKVGASPYGKLVDSTLKLIGFESPPTEAAGWERAFFLLSSEYTSMRSNLTTENTVMRSNLTNEYIIMKQNLTSALKDSSNAYSMMKENLTNAYSMMKENLTNAYSMMKENLTNAYIFMKNNLTNEVKELSKDYSLMKTNLSNECSKYKDDYMRVASVQFTRRILEDADYSLTYGGFGFPSIAEMKKQLQKDKGHLDETAVSEAKNFDMHETLRRMRWLFYMTYANSSFAVNLRTLLCTWNVSAFTLSGFIDRVYSVTCEKIHGFSVQGLDVKAAESGFQMYGVRDKALLHCLRIIFEIPNLTGFLPDN